MNMITFEELGPDGAVHTRYDIEMTDLRKSNDYVQFYSLITSGIVMVLVPFGALIMAYVAIFR